jgi:hypothetical protein
LLLFLWGCSAGAPLGASPQTAMNDGSAVGDASTATADVPVADESPDLGESSVVIGDEDSPSSIGDSLSPNEESASNDAEPLPTEAAEAAACPPSPAVGDFPLDVGAALHAKCQTCHRSPPVSHAPFPLLNYEQVIVSFAGQGGAIPRWQRMQQVIQPGSVPHMPLGVAPPLTDAEKQTLDTWFAGCATPVPEGTGGDVDSDASVPR